MCTERGGGDVSGRCVFYQHVDHVNVGERGLASHDCQGVRPVKTATGEGGSARSLVDMLEVRLFCPSSIILTCTIRLPFITPLYLLYQFVHADHNTR